MKNAPPPGADSGSRTNRNIDLERREDRFLIYIRDTQDVIDAFAEFTEVVEYADTPVTQTLYMGDSVRGLPSGLSIKARTYNLDRLAGRWDVRPETIFDLLEIKRSVPVAVTGEAGLKAAVAAPPDQIDKARGFEETFEVMALAARSLDKATMKSKKRTGRMTMAQVLDLLSRPLSFHGKIPDDLYLFLLENVYPINDYRWMPLTGTEYRRKHFKAKDAACRDCFRATLDTRVTHYTFVKQNELYIGTPVGVEDFSRLELKADQEQLKGTSIGRKINEIIRRFKAFRTPSKKYRGLTLRGHEHIGRCGFMNENAGKIIEGTFKASPVRYKDREHYVNLARYIRTLDNFRLHGDKPVLLEEHVNSVMGCEGGLVVRLTGNSVIYEREREVKKRKGLQLAVYDRNPVSEIPVESRDELDLGRFTGLKEKNNEYLRSKGFLVQHKQTKRVYKVALERLLRGQGKSEEQVRIRYIGREGKVDRFERIKPIVEEIRELYGFLKKYPLFKDIGE